MAYRPKTYTKDKDTPSVGNSKYSRNREKADTNEPAPAVKTRAPEPTRRDTETVTKTPYVREHTKDRDTKSSTSKYSGTTRSTVRHIGTATASTAIASGIPGTTNTRGGIGGKARSDRDQAQLLHDAPKKWDREKKGTKKKWTDF